MHAWLTAVMEPAVLVTVALVEGSGPREPGAKMLVTRSRQFDTIGGGHLELCAVDLARAMLDDPTAAGQANASRLDDPAAAAAGQGNASRLERYALGPTLGQCCGGVVHLAFEVVDAALGAVLAGLRSRTRTRTREDCWRLSAIDGAPVALLLDADDKVIAGQGAMPVWHIDSGTGTTGANTIGANATGTNITGTNTNTTGTTTIVRDATGRRWLIDACPAPRAHLLLFGAGHVGAAIIRTLGELPCTVTWIDERQDLFPDQVPANVTVEATDTPEALVARAPAGASYLVLTHSHALDQRLSEAILARPNVGWFGLIGSATKRVQFERRLAARGIAQDRIAAMVCPIGLPGITSKLPAAIAASVCAQLLMVWEVQHQQQQQQQHQQHQQNHRSAVTH